jgi:FkbM family methyltransferase
MKDVGESRVRNEEFARRFSRERVIQSVVTASVPTIIDVGAHHGQSALYLRELFPGSTIHSFEPDPDSFQRLASLGLSGHHCTQAALSDRRGQVTFFRNAISHTNSLYKVNLGSNDSIKLTEARRTGGNDFSRSLNQPFEVRCSTLDDYCEEAGIGRVDLLKIDVQGAEASVLRGAARTLESTGAVVLEASFYDFYEHKTAISELEHCLGPAGLSLFSILEISQNPMNGRTDWAELLYTRDGRAGSGTHHSAGRDHR